MTSDAQYQWTNEYGLPSPICTHEPITEEINSVAAEIRALLPHLRSADPQNSASASTDVSRLVTRYNQLCADLKGWNSFVADQHESRYQSFVKLIDALLNDATKLRFIHELNSMVDVIEIQHKDGALIGMFDPVDETTHNLIANAAEAIGVLAPRDPSMRDTIHWVRTTALLNRADYPSENQAFSWTDQYGHPHELRSIRKIEHAFIHMVYHLTTFRRIFEAGSTASKAKHAPEFEAELTQIQNVQAGFVAWGDHMSAIEQQSRRNLADEIERIMNHEPE